MPVQKCQQKQLVDFKKCKPETAYLKSFKSRENDLIKSNSLSQTKNYLWCLFC